MIVKMEFHTYFVQTAVLYPLFSVTTNVASVSTLTVKCQWFGMDTDQYISVGNRVVGLQCLPILSPPPNPTIR